MSMLLPLITLWFYATEAGAQFTITGASKEQDVVSYGSSIPLETNASRYNVHIITINFPSTSYSISSVVCSMGRPNEEPHFSVAQCGTIYASGTTRNPVRRFTNLPVAQGENEFQVLVTAQGDGNTWTSIFTTQWFVHTQDAPPPEALNRLGENVAALADANGNCNPVVVPIRVEHLAHIAYRINNDPSVGGFAQQPQAPASPAMPPSYVNYNLQLPGAAFNEDRTFSLELWSADHTRGAPSRHATWTVECPPGVTAVLGEPRPQTGYASKATFYFSTEGGQAPLFCSLDDADFELCTSPHSYAGLKAGLHTLRVYAQTPAGSPGVMVSHPWEVLPPATNFQRIPPNSSASTALFQFAAAEGVDVPVYFKCSIDGGSFFECESPFLLKALELGEHRFEVQATSSVGAGKVASHVWKVSASTQKDASVVILEPASGSKLPGLQQIKGQAAPGSEIQGLLLHADTSHVFSCTADAQGAWICAVDLSSALEEGAWQLFIWALAEAEEELSAFTSVDFQINRQVDSSVDLVSIQSGGCSGCSAASGLPLSLVALAGLWAMRRRRG